LVLEIMVVAVVEQAHRLADLHHWVASLAHMALCVLCGKSDPHTLIPIPLLIMVRKNGISEQIN
jgi:hypothetical protein